LLEVIGPLVGYVAREITAGRGITDLGKKLKG
jgi:hypothetical protein